MLVCRMISPPRILQGVRNFSSTTSQAQQTLLDALSKLDTASLCDADKGRVSRKDGENHGVRVMKGLVPRNSVGSRKMVGIARTVQCTEPNDFLAVLRGLSEANEGEVLVVNTLNSTRAVAGELFCAEAARKGVVGIFIDGPMRDTAYLEEFSTRVHCYSTTVTPYSGRVQSVGEMQIPVQCGGVEVSPGDFLLADNDGVIVASGDSFAEIIETAANIQETERIIKERVSKGTSLHSLTNYEEHVEARVQGSASSLEFRVD